jgi:hypothetical protein
MPQKHRLATLHRPRGGAVVQHGDFPARGHDLQEMCIRRHAGVAVMGLEQFGRLAGACRRCRQRNFAPPHAVADGSTASLHHRHGDLASIAGQLQFSGRFYHSHPGNDWDDIAEARGLDDGAEVIAHDGRHMIGLNRYPARVLQSTGQRGAPLVVQPVVPGSDPVHDSGGLGHVPLHGGRNQQAGAVCWHDQDGRPAKLHMQIVVVAGVVVDTVVIGDQCSVETRLGQAFAQGSHAVGEHQSGPSCCSTSVAQNEAPMVRASSQKS